MGLVEALYLITDYIGSSVFIVALIAATIILSNIGYDWEV